MEIKPETPLERKIVSSEVFRIGSAHSSNSSNHPERLVSAHIQQILDFIDSRPWEEYRNPLRLLALLHDLGKHRVQYSENGHVIGKPHSVHSEQIARDFIGDEDLLYVVRIHDKYFHFFKDAQRDRFDQDKFLRVYGPAEMSYLIRFNYADSNNRERDSVAWFEDKAFDLGLVKLKLYETEDSLI